MSGSFTPTCSNTEPTTTRPRAKCTGTKSQRKGYQPSVLKKPVASCTRVAETRIATLTRSTALRSERTGGQRNRFG